LRKEKQGGTENERSGKWGSGDKVHLKDEAKKEKASEEYQRERIA
jgi:hypothetical protein